jgi:hypothetical protein
LAAKREGGGRIARPKIRNSDQGLIKEFIEAVEHQKLE